MVASDPNTTIGQHGLPYRIAGLGTFWVGSLAERVMPGCAVVLFCIMLYYAVLVVLFMTGCHVLRPYVT